MGRLARLFRVLRGKPAPHPNEDASFESLVWLEPSENPFGVRVLDCRPIAESFMSGSKDEASVRFFGSAEARSGEQFQGQHPQDTLRASCELVYPLATPLPEGPVFLAGAMEEKWNIYHFADVLYFVRSWTGQLQYAARLAQSPSELRVVEVEAWRGNVLGVDTLAIRQVDFLLRSHLFGEVFPHPTPALPTKKGIALWSFSQYGRRGLYAAVEGKRGSGTEIGN